MVERVFVLFLKRKIKSLCFTSLFIFLHSHEHRVMLGWQAITIFMMTHEILIITKPTTCLYIIFFNKYQLVK